MLLNIVCVQAHNHLRSHLSFWATFFFSSQGSVRTCVYSFDFRISPTPCRHFLPAKCRKCNDLHPKCKSLHLSAGTLTFLFLMEPKPNNCYPQPPRPAQKKGEVGRTSEILTYFLDDLYIHPLVILGTG